MSLQQLGTQIILGLLIIGILSGIFFLYIPYTRDIRDAYRTLRERERGTVDTPYGPVEYGREGEGQPLLVIHGAAGGFDQGLSLAADQVGEGYDIVAPSRFGYLGTPLPENASVEMQVEALIALLDALGIEKTAVMTFSAGGSSAVRLALRHPERVSALVMVSTAIADKPLRLPPKPVLRRIMGSDFLFWVLANPLRPLAQGMFVPGDLQLSAEDIRVVDQSFGELLPIEPRSRGLVFDMYTTNTDPYLNAEDYRLENVQVPTLIVNAKDDPAADYGDAVRMAERIPEAEFLSIDSGGHLMLGNGNRVKKRVMRFLESQVSD